MSELDRVLQTIEDDLYYNGRAEDPITREYLYNLIRKLRDAAVHDEIGRR